MLLLIGKSEISEFLFDDNQEGLLVSLALSKAALPCRKLRDFIWESAPEEVVKSIDYTDLACNGVSIAKS